MRTRLSAAFLLLLSWFLPPAAHAQAVAQITVAQAQAWRPDQHHSGVRQLPPPAPALRAWAGPGSTTGTPAALATGLPAFHAPWAVVVGDPAAGTPPARRPLAAAARAPPSTVR
ncbi:hypothetical protein AB0C27_30240 [Nonomuraea sp. NPDC048882]|uniref:hypothetical protein n=1 Tax=Nonomuraea sp. NPDC048882 TaxID=3154347 RepID=UPI0033C70B3B